MKERTKKWLHYKNMANDLEKERANTQQLYFENHHIDCIGRNEHKYTLYVAFASDEKKHVIGYIQYSTINEELHIENVEVKEELRGQGIGKSLYKKLFELNPNADYQASGYYTREGSRIRQWFNETILPQQKGD